MSNGDAIGLNPDELRIYLEFSNTTILAADFGNMLKSVAGFSGRHGLPQYDCRIRRILSGSLDAQLGIEVSEEAAAALEEDAEFQRLILRNADFIRATFGPDAIDDKFGALLELERTKEEQKQVRREQKAQRREIGAAERQARAEQRTKQWQEDRRTARIRHGQMLGIGIVTVALTALGVAATFAGQATADDGNPTATTVARLMDAGVIGVRVTSSMAAFRIDRSQVPAFAALRDGSLTKTPTPDASPADPEIPTAPAPREADLPSDTDAHAPLPKPDTATVDTQRGRKLGAKALGVDLTKGRAAYVEGVIEFVDGQILVRPWPADGSIRTPMYLVLADDHQLTDQFTYAISGRAFPTDRDYELLFVRSARHVPPRPPPRDAQ